MGSRLEGRHGSNAARACSQQAHAARQAGVKSRRSRDEIAVREADESHSHRFRRGVYRTSRVYRPAFISAKRVEGEPAPTDRRRTASPGRARGTGDASEPRRTSADRDAHPGQACNGDRCSAPTRERLTGPNGTREVGARGGPSARSPGDHLGTSRRVPPNHPAREPVAAQIM